MGVNKIARFCQSVLPAEFEQVKRLAPVIQRFLEENLPEPVNRSVTVLTVNSDDIVIAANSPLVANYLRLHGKEIQQQLKETFELEQSLKFRSIPDSLIKPQKHEHLRQSEPVSAESVAALKRSVQWVEDEDLKKALLSLADSLKQD